MNHFFVYILKCKDGSYYVGHTDDLEKRLFEHQSGVYEGYTTRRRPVSLVFHQTFHLRNDAFAAERKIKNWSRSKKEALIKGDWQLLQLLAKKDFKK